MLTLGEMLAEEKVLARGYETVEAAMAPLVSARPWMKNVEGEVSLPVSGFVFQYSEGRSKIRYRVSVAAEKEEDGFAAVLRIERISFAEAVGLGGGALLFCSAVAIGAGVESLAIVAPFVFIVPSIRIAYVLMHTDEVLDTFSLPYEKA